MPQLMLSLDKNIFDPTSSVAERMSAYGKEVELFVIIPQREITALSLGSKVHVRGSGGNTKVAQFFLMLQQAVAIIRESKIHVISSQDPFYLGLLGLLLSIWYSIALEVQVHGDFFNGYYAGPKLALARFVLRHATTVRTVGERVKKSLLAIGVPESKIVVRPVAFDGERIKNFSPSFDLHKKYPQFTKIFLFLGRGDAVKNVHWLMDVFSAAVTNKTGYGLVVVGTRCTNAPASVVLEPWTKDHYSYIKTADAVLVPSLSESYSLVAVEAAAAGTPLIMNDVGVANYELKPSEKVKILPINDTDAWTKAILNI